MKRYRPLLAAAAALALALGSSAAAQQTVALPDRDRALQLPAKTLFQVGELEGEDYENFGAVNDVAFDARGNLYVLDATGFHIIVFDPAGKYLRTIGRQGDGPGEFGMPMALAILPGGELVVNDAAKANLQIFGPDGTFRRTVVLPETLGRAAGRMRVSPRGGVITETMQLVQRTVNQGQRDAPQRMQLPGRSVTRLAIGDSVRGSRLFTTPPRDMQLGAAREASGGIRVSMSMRAFEPSLLWSPTADGGTAVLNDATYRIGLLDPAGRTTRHLERAIKPRKVTDTDKKRFLENQKKGVGTGGSGGMIAFAATTASAGSAGTGATPPLNRTTTMRMGSMDLKESDVTWGDVIPVVTALGTDSFGRLWIQRAGPELGDGPIDVVDPSLRYLGTLAAQEMPRAFGPGGRLAYLVKDDMDVQHVVVKQLLR